MSKNHDEKSPVKFRVVCIEGREGYKDPGNIKLLWQRGSDLSGATKVFKIGDLINEDFGFTSTFQYSKGILRPKTFELSISCRNMIIGTVKMNLSDYFTINRNEEHEINKEIVLGKEMFYIKLLILFGDKQLSKPKESKGTTRIITYNTPQQGKSNLIKTMDANMMGHAKKNSGQKRVLSSSVAVNSRGMDGRSHGSNESETQSNIQHQRPKTSVLSSQSELRKGLGESGTAYQHARMRSIDRGHRQQDSKDALENLPMGPAGGALGASKQGSFGGLKREGTMRDLRVGVIRRHTSDAVREDEEVFLKDLKDYAMLMAYDNMSNKPTDNLVLTQLVYTVITPERLKQGTGFSALAATHIGMLVDDSRMHFKHGIYLYSAISKLIFLYENLLKKQRIDAMSNFCDDLKRSLNALYPKLIAMMSANLHKACSNSFNQGCSERPILQEMNGIIQSMTEVRMIQPFKNILINDIFRLLNLAFYDELIKGRCSFEIGLQMQMMIAMVSDIEYKHKNSLTQKDSLMIIKELSRVLVLSQKNLLIDDSRLDICPHITIEMLVNVLTDYEKNCPGEIPPGTISLLQRNMNDSRTEYYDYSLPELKEQRIKDALRDCGDVQSTQFDFSQTELIVRPYLKGQN